VVDVAGSFFTPRMGPERLRLANCVGRGERVLVMFCGVGMEGLMIAGRREVESVTMVEMNPKAAECARKGRLLLKGNKAAVKAEGSGSRSDVVEVLEGDVGDVVPTLPRDHYDRVIVPRPKDGSADGDLGTGTGGAEHLRLLLPHLKRSGGTVHWYDFAADWEVEGGLERTRGGVKDVCDAEGYDVHFLHAGKAGSKSIAKKQYRVCVDFTAVAR
jgi:tRNA G37 N-methylase Trm5